jgi:hypothetical protein
VSWPEEAVPVSGFFPSFPVTNRKTRRHCDHQYKKILLRTACVKCGQDAPKDNNDARTK